MSFSDQGLNEGSVQGVHHLSQFPKTVLGNLFLIFQMREMKMDSEVVRPIAGHGFMKKLTPQCWMIGPAILLGYGRPHAHVRRPRSRQKVNVSNTIPNSINGLYCNNIEAMAVKNYKLTYWSR